MIILTSEGKCFRSDCYSLPPKGEPQCVQKIGSDRIEISELCHERVIVTQIATMIRRARHIRNVDPRYLKLTEQSPSNRSRRGHQRTATASASLGDWAH